MADEPDQVLNSAEVADLLRISERQARKMARSGDLPARTLTSDAGARVRYRFSRNAILEWLRQGGTPPQE